MEVSEDGSILVTETMGVHFTEQRHGIYVDVPEKYHMSWEINGQDRYKTYYFPVTDVKVLSGHEYSTDHQSNGVRIQIGSGSFYANEDETYKWQYKFHTRDLELDGLQMVFMNIVDDYAWDTDTESCDFIITMPKSFDPTQIAVASPEGMMYGTGTKGNMTVDVVGNVIKGSYKGVIHNDQGLTIQVMLDDNYFKFAGMDKYGMISVIFAGIISLLSTIIFFRHGKDDPVIRTVEFYAPEGLNSAEVGMVIDEEVNNSDIVSLLLDWGRRGYITIEETEDNLILKKVMDPGEEMEGYERNFFENIFRGKETRSVNSMKYSFYKKMERVKADIEKKFSKKKFKLSTDSSELFQILVTLLAGLPICFAIILCWRKYYFQTGPTMLLSLIVIIATICGSAIVNYTVQKTYVFKPVIKVLIIAGAVLCFAVPVVIGTLVLENVKVKAMFGLIILGLSVVIIVEAAFMKKKTAYGNEMLGKVLGLREFIKVAEEDRLKMLQEQDPMYFYNILPFAYALGLSNIWNDHFK
ncbi:MAG: DUF2207 domain-containing protein, partial [Erysipelotrichaceae bacterium]|nr:DUF2207 domain-containing protein [Erysipelotrichaceae bacterium]